VGADLQAVRVAGVTLAQAALAVSVLSLIVVGTRHVDGQKEEMSLRATSIYRRKNGAWKVIHRHGDSLMTVEIDPREDGEPSELMVGISSATSPVPPEISAFGNDATGWPTS